MIFDTYIENRLNRVKGSAYADMMDENVCSKLKSALEQITANVTENTMMWLIANEASSDNLLALELPGMITAKEREKALKSIKAKLDNGEMALPKPLTGILELRLDLVTDAFLEMLSRLDEKREEISRALTDGNSITKINDVTMSAGDTHNHGRSVTVLYTNAGRIVYKPHDMRGDEHIYALAQRFFPEFVGVPKSIAFGSDYGFCEFIEKIRPKGKEESKDFFYALGGLAAFCKIMGSTDMHIENITCHGVKPYILDLETVVSPISINNESRLRYGEIIDLKNRSPYLSALLPFSAADRELSVLMNTAEEGCLPEIDGKIRTVTYYLDEFKSGYDAAYKRALENRGELSAMIGDFPETMPVRFLLRQSQTYVDYMKKLYHHTALSSEENQKNAEDILTRIFSKYAKPDYKKTVNIEIEQLKRGDIPYIYTYAGRKSLFSDGEEIISEFAQMSAIEHALNNLSLMGEKDERFDLALLERAIEQYPRKLNVFEKEKPVELKVSDEALSKTAALNEATELLYKIYDIRLEAPSGKLLWGYIEQKAYAFRFCESGLYEGLTGAALFAAACAYVSDEKKVRDIADRIIKEAVDDLFLGFEYLRNKNFDFDYSPTLGEATGIAGMITATELINSYVPFKETERIRSGIDEFLDKTDFAPYGAPDRVLGLAGFLSALCRFEYYRNKKEIIKTVADRLLTLKTIDFRDKKLWMPFADKQRPISGAGHGMAGIAESLFAASKVLSDEKYAAAAADALDFEIVMYKENHEKIGSWPDLRMLPATHYMHGYCSGAPGIGIMARRIKEMGIENEQVNFLEEAARKSVDKLPLNTRDHLCCGNSAVVEYYLSTGDRDAAGRILLAAYKRKCVEGKYRYMAYDYHNVSIPSLFYGLSGVGYEMLRYAFPEKIFSVL